MKLSESELNSLMKKALKYDDHHFVDIQCVNLRSVLQELELARAALKIAGEFRKHFNTSPMTTLLATDVADSWQELGQALRGYNDFGEGGQ